MATRGGAEHIQWDVGMSAREPEAAAALTRPDPVFTPDAAFFWEGAARGELLGQRCARCLRFAHPPRPMCPHCHSTQREVIKLTGRGTVYSWIMPRHPQPLGFAESPVVALIDLQEGIRLVSNVIDVPLARMRPGLPVEVTFAPTQGGRAVPIFRPVTGG
jgi:uncharacterized OB-fold protein